MLWDISLAVPVGEITCIVGSNGAGKTTLLRTISGLLKAASGRILFAGEDITPLAADQVLARGIVHVPEGRRLFRGLNVHDNLLLGAYLRRDDAEIRRDLDYVFTLFPILRDAEAGRDDALGRRAADVRDRTRDHVAPKLLMIDELSLGLAPRLVERLSEALLRDQPQRHYDSAGRAGCA